jgi:hypothetical protein
MYLLDEECFISGIGEGVSVRCEFYGFSNLAKIVNGVVKNDFRTFGFWGGSLC